MATINFYHHVLSKDDAEQTEKICRGHNTWKKEDDERLLLSTYITIVDKEEEGNED